jgi:hypothetical protein
VPHWTESHDGSIAPTADVRLPTVYASSRERQRAVRSLLLEEAAGVEIGVHGNVNAQLVSHPTMMQQQLLLVAQMAFRNRL